MKTIFVNESAQKRNWYIVDAADKPLGRVAAAVAAVLRGKNKATYTPNQNMGDYVVVINADKVVVSGNKGENMMYRHHTGFVHGLREFSFNELVVRHPVDPFRRTLAGMLPNGRLGRALMDNVKIYAGSEHPHAAQNPQPLEV